MEVSEQLLKPVSALCSSTRLGPATVLPILLASAGASAAARGITPSTDPVSGAKVDPTRRFFHRHITPSTSTSVSSPSSSSEGGASSSDDDDDGGGGFGGGRDGRGKVGLAQTRRSVAVGVGSILEPRRLSTATNASVGFDGGNARLPRGNARHSDGGATMSASFARAAASTTPSGAGERASGHHRGWTSAAFAGASTPEYHAPGAGGSATTPGSALLSGQKKPDAHVAALMRDVRARGKELYVPQVMLNVDTASVMLGMSGMWHAGKRVEWMIEQVRGAYCWRM